MKLEYIVTTLTNYNTIKQVLKEEFLMSDRLIAKLKNSNKIYLNNNVVSINKCFSVGDTISIDLDFEETCDNILPTKMDLDIIYEDESFLIVNKPPFMPVHPSMDHFEDSLSNGVKYYFNSINLNRKIRPVNRLDKNTSGIVIFAKNSYVQECLIKQMKTGSFQKEYLAILKGTMTNKKQIVDVPIARKEGSIIERCVNENGAKSVTIFEVQKNHENYSLVKCILKTGRTHQIRVHSKYINHPVLGDDLYDEKSKLINRQALHSYKVSFIHPITKEKVCFKAELPKDIKELIN